MGTVIIFALITIFSAYGAVKSVKNKNILASLFAVGTFLVFGWFTFMTVINNGYPAVH